MNKNITIKNVAGFHSFDLAFFFMASVGDFFRRGLGIRLSQNEVLVTPGEVAYGRGNAVWNGRGKGTRELRKVGGARSTRRSIVDLFIDA